MEKIAIIGDPHFGRKAEHPLIKKFVKEGQDAFYEFLIAQLKERNIKTVLITGDLHDTRQSINVEALVNTKRILQSKMKDFDIHIVLGNHDMYYENSYDITSLELFEDIPNVTVYREGIVTKNFLNKTWYMVPWIIHENESKVTEFLEKMGKKPIATRNNTVFFGHFELFGINMEGNSISSFGLDPNLLMNASNRIFSGHYHGKSITKKTDSHLVYVGSPYPLTFANANAEHGFWIVDENLDYEFIKNEVSPSFIDIWDTDDLDSLPDLTNSFIRLYIDKTITSEKEFEIRLKIENKKPILVRTLSYNGTKEEIQSKPEIEREANRIVKMSSMEIAEIYIDQTFDSLPKLSLTPDPKQEILKRLTKYNETSK
jgi:DNA repair exonuclease SbcCD nuclease subunit